MAIRRYQAGDLDTVMRIEHASFPEDAYSEAMFHDLERTCGPLFLVAEEKGRVVGYAVAGLRGEHAEVISIAVEPAARRRGYGRQLFRSLLDRVRRRDVSRVTLVVREGNEAARTFYESFRFERVRRLPGYYQGRADGILMRRRF